MGCLNPNLPKMGLTVDLLKPNAAVGMADYDKALAEGNKCPVTQQSVSSNTAPQDNLFNSSATTPSSRQQYSN